MYLFVCDSSGDHDRRLMFYALAYIRVCWWCRCWSPGAVSPAWLSMFGMAWLALTGWCWLSSQHNILRATVKAHSCMVSSSYLFTNNWLRILISLLPLAVALFFFSAIRSLARSHAALNPKRQFVSTFNTMLFSLILCSIFLTHSILFLKPFYACDITSHARIQHHMAHWWAQRKESEEKKTIPASFGGFNGQLNSADSNNRTHNRLI